MIGRLLEEKQFESSEEVNDYIQQFVGPGKTIPSPQRELVPYEKAQDIIYDAWEEQSRAKRIKLAHKALALSPDCADAYVLLAEETAQTPEDAKRLYEQGVKGGELALGKEFMDENVGDFWGMLETRPYMRARFGLAQALWALGNRKEAIGHYKELLRLNPNDNQGVRSLLINALLEEGLDDDAEALLNQYDDEASAEWLYSGALWAFRRFGSSPKADRRLKKALKGNRFVPLYMLELKKMPRRLPEYIRIGEEDEAMHYVAGAIGCWAETPGAGEWLAEVTTRYIQLNDH
ncbi:MAG: tetratricopeptide repeat protein [Thermoplasmata archaeon]|nr:tetratricopeptide repeat protein [Thermoplasmata archaeon]